MRDFFLLVPLFLLHAHLQGQDLDRHLYRHFVFWQGTRVWVVCSLIRVMPIFLLAILAGHFFDWPGRQLGDGEKFCRPGAVTCPDSLINICLVWKINVFFTGFNLVVVSMDRYIKTWIYLTESHVWCVILLRIDLPLSRQILWSNDKHSSLDFDVYKQVCIEKCTGLSNVCVYAKFGIGWFR